MVYTFQHICFIAFVYTVGVFQHLFVALLRAGEQMQQVAVNCHPLAGGCVCVTR